MTQSVHPWGQPFWEVPLAIRSEPLPESVDVAVAGAGLTGLSAAGHLARLGLRVAVLEAGRVGEGASGRSGGIALEDTAAGPLEGFANCLEELTAFDCEFEPSGCWEISHSSALPLKPLDWKDQGKQLRVSGCVAGGTVNPGKLLAAVAHKAQAAGATVHEQMPVAVIEFTEPLRLRLPGRSLTAQRAVLAINAYAFELSALEGEAAPKLTLALATQPIGKERIAALGLAEPRPFYTSDLPYLWGRLAPGDRLLVGGGLVEMHQAPTAEPLPAAKPRFQALEERLHGLHAALRDIAITHRWLGPILIPEDFRPILRRHPRSRHVFFGGGYAGHGLAQSLRMGKLLAQAVAADVE